MFGWWGRKEYSNGGGAGNGRGEYGEFESLDDGVDLGDDVGKDELRCVSEDGCLKRCNWITKSSGKQINRQFTVVMFALTRAHTQSTTQFRIVHMHICMHARTHKS